jgi:1,4-alpha-glucan branching enzyme
MAPGKSAAYNADVKPNTFAKLTVNRPNESASMKHNHNHDNLASAGPQLVPVRFEFTHPTATAVCVAGSFNHWQPESKTLHSTSTGRWWKETALAPGTYEYCLVVDGQWIPDPLATETVPNPFGGRNSILRVANSPEAAHLDNAEHFPLKTHKLIENTKL